MLLIVTYDVLYLVGNHVNDSELDALSLPFLPQISGVLGVGYAVNGMIGHETSKISMAQTARTTLEVLERRFHDVVQIPGECD